MYRYEVRITQILETEVEVEAEDSYSARDKVYEMYKKGSVVLTKDDMVDDELTIISEHYIEEDEDYDPDWVMEYEWMMNGNK